jgi:hypothetical protein
MANRLYSTNNSNHNTFKYKIDCQAKLSNNSDTKDWLELIKVIPHDSPDYKLFTALLEKEKEIVVKIGPSILKKEFEISKSLESLKLPTFLHYYCIFQCLEDFKTLNNSSKYLCKDSGEKVTVLVMPNITLGQIGNYKWNRDNFNILKNIIKHIISSLFFAYKEIDFIHKDLHLGNIVMKKTKRKEIDYGEYGILECLGFIPIIMDYDKSLIKEDSQQLVFNDIKRYLGHISSDTNIVFNTFNIQNELIKLYNNNEKITTKIIKQLYDMVDKCKIDYMLDERPPLPNFLKPKKV